MLNYIKSKVSKHLDGDVDLFCEIYLQGPLDNWSITRDKNHIYYIFEKNGFITDSDGSKIYGMFRNYYIDALLKLGDLYITELGAMSDEIYKKQQGDILDIFDLLEKVCLLCTIPYTQFIAKMDMRFSDIEKSLELAKML